ncbi:MAG TPA: hypothetical protein VE954_05870 [Oligoflexus sp.]|uniref:hypothetical protein n=1 Tax=Oligoflexus sp. TaxID=1971216 RepID=UPI002D3D70E4|nr:hypothetical protein [Oligoflexus sp.]HYX32620.1 hypothetical protein [Oligoflexus sp.]
MKTIFCIALMFASGAVHARDCDVFFYSGAPEEILRYKVEFIKKEIPEIYFAELPRPISKGSDLAIEWSKQAADCLLNPTNGILASFVEAKTLPRLLELRSSLHELSAPYSNDTLFETRRINQALKKSLEEFKRSVSMSEPPKISYLRGVLTQSCGSFGSIETNVGIITALRLPIELRKNYIREFCGKDQEASRTEVLKKFEEIELQCNNGSTEACDLKDVFDSVDCSRVDSFLNQDFEGLITKFEALAEKVEETREICATNIRDLIDTCIELDLGKNVCLIPAAEVGACERLEIGSEYCAT